MNNFGKPSYINEKFLEATNAGWVDKRTGEVLVAVNRLKDKLESQNKVVRVESPVVVIDKEQTDSGESIVEDHVDSTDPELSTEIDTIINESVETKKEPEQVKDASDTNSPAVKQRKKRSNKKVISAE